MTPTERTLKLLREKYIICDIVERFCHNNKTPHGLRSDLFHIFDIIALSEEHIIGVQSCGTDFAAHYRKITQRYRKNALLWLNCGGKIELIGWRKIKAFRGSKKMVPAPRIKQITRGDLNANTIMGRKVRTKKEPEKMSDLPLFQVY